MIFSEDEKRIISKIAESKYYSIDDFCSYRFSDRINKKVEWNQSDKEWNRIKETDKKEITEETELDKEKIIEEITNFIKIWVILEKNNLVMSHKNNQEEWQKNRRNLATIDKSGSIQTWHKEEDALIEFVDKKLIIFNDLKEFVEAGYKTKREIKEEEDKEQTEKALKYAKQNFWIAFFLSIISILISVYVSFYYTTTVKIKDFDKMMEKISGDIINTRYAAELKKINKEKLKIKDIDLDLINSIKKNSNKAVK